MYKVVLERIATDAEQSDASPPQETFLRSRQPGKYQPVVFLLCMLTFVGCFLLTITPLIHFAQLTLPLSIPLGSLLATASAWLPRTLGRLSQLESSLVECFCLFCLAFVCYSMSLWLVWRQWRARDHSMLRSFMWLGAILVGGLYLVTPALLSHDTLSYASYSRIMTIYHANPYFITISAFPGDILNGVNDWSQTISVYGPIWLAVCWVLGWLPHADPAAYVMAFRLVALAAHLLNIWLIGRILQITNRSPRVVTLGMLLYAWNPLILMESSLSGHNDGFMITFLLLGILLAFQAEKQGYLLRVRGLVLPMVAFTLAALVKFTCLPVLAAYVLFLVCKALRPTPANPRAFLEALRRWPRAVVVLCWTGGTGLVLALVLYSPFWIGHDLHAIVGSFTNNTASTWAVNSLERSIIKWGALHPALQHNHLFSILSRRQVWNDLVFLAIAVCLVVGAIRLWIQPALSTFLLLALATMSLVLLLTPWFYPWYLTWIVGLAAVCIPKRRERFSMALFALTFIYSFSVLAHYLFMKKILGSHDYLDSLFYIIPPICAFLLCWIIYSQQSRVKVANL